MVSIIINGKGEKSDGNNWKTNLWTGRAKVDSSLHTGTCRGLAMDWRGSQTAVLCMYCIKPASSYQ